MFVGFVGLRHRLERPLRQHRRPLPAEQRRAATNDAVERLTTQVQTADRRTKANPSDAAAWAALAQARIRLAQVGDNFDPAASDYTAEGRRQLTAAGAAWDKYVALDPPKPDERLARQMDAGLPLAQQARQGRRRPGDARPRSTRPSRPSRTSPSSPTRPASSARATSPPARPSTSRPRTSRRSSRNSSSRPSPRPPSSRSRRPSRPPRRPSASPLRRYPVRPRPCSSTGRAADS